MSTPIDRPLQGYRIVETRHGDTLQAIAAREMGDASRWPEIVSYNRLLPPFITDDPLLAGPGIILSGEPIRIPAPAPAANAFSNPDATFLADIKLTNGLIEADGAGDMMLCEGLPNLRQALVHRVVTERGELMYHPSYGSLIKRLLGTVNGPTASLLAAQYARDCSRLLVHLDACAKPVVAAVAGLHLWKKNTMLSIGGGTILYMVLVQFVFPG